MKIVKFEDFSTYGGWENFSFLKVTTDEGIVGWAPISGNQPMSFTISSYNGSVVVGIACDTELVPDHEMIVDGFSFAFGRLFEASPGAELMPIRWASDERGRGRRR